MLTCKTRGSSHETCITRYKRNRIKPQRQCFFLNVKRLNKKKENKPKKISTLFKHVTWVINPSMNLELTKKKKKPL